MQTRAPNARTFRDVFAARDYSPFGVVGEQTTRTRQNSKDFVSPSHSHALPKQTPATNRQAIINLIKILHLPLKGMFLDPLIVGCLS